MTATRTTTRIFRPGRGSPSIHAGRRARTAGNGVPRSARTPDPGRLERRQRAVRTGGMAPPPGTRNRPAAAPRPGTTSPGSSPDSTSPGMTSPAMTEGPRTTRQPGTTRRPGYQEEPGEAVPPAVRPRGRQAAARARRNRRSLYLWGGVLGVAVLIGVGVWFLVSGGSKPASVPDPLVTTFQAGEFRTCPERVHRGDRRHARPVPAREADRRLAELAGRRRGQPVQLDAGPPAALPAAQRPGAGVHAERPGQRGRQRHVRGDGRIHLRAAAEDQPAQGHPPAARPRSPRSRAGHQGVLRAAGHPGGPGSRRT